LEKANPPGLWAVLLTPQVIKIENGSCCVVERTGSLPHIVDYDLAVRGDNHAMILR
jgi:hypothetical protein